MVSLLTRSLGAGVGLFARCGLATEGLRTQAQAAVSPTPIPTGNQRSGSCRRWRGTGSLQGLRPEARCRAGPPAGLVCGPRPACQRFPGPQRDTSVASPVGPEAPLHSSCHCFSPQRPEMTETRHVLPQDPPQDPAAEGASGAGPRTLTRAAMEQIRHLHKEFAETWSVSRLAQGFDVSTDVIRRVLKSKFVPTLEQKLKQDRKVLKKAELALCLQELAGSVDSSKSLSADHLPVPSALLVAGSELSSTDQSQASSLKVIEPNAHSTASPRRQKRREARVQALEAEGCAPVTAGPSRQQLQQKHSASNRETGCGGWLKELVAKTSAAKW